MAMSITGHPDGAMLQKRLEKEITHLAYHDALTGLPNRFLLEDRLEQGLALASRRGSLLAVMLLAFQAFVARVPFDISEAETEIMEGPLIEYSGPKLAIFKYAQMVKLVVFSALFIGIFVPWGSGLILPLAFIIFWIKVFVLVLMVTVLAATHARYRIDQAIRYFAAMLAVGFVALIIASNGF